MEALAGKSPQDSQSDNRNYMDYPATLVPFCYTSQILSVVFV